LTPIGGLEAAYAVHLRLIGKLVVDFLFVLIERLSLGVTAEALRADIDWKSAFLKGIGQHRPNFHVFGDVPREPFLHDRWIDQWMPYNFVANSIHTKKLCSRLSSSSEVQL